MKALSRLALGLAIASLVLSAYIVASSPRALQQLQVLFGRFLINADVMISQVGKDTCFGRVKSQL